MIVDGRHARARFSRASMVCLSRGDEMSILAAQSAWRELGEGVRVLDAAEAVAAYGRDTTGVARRIAGALVILDASVLPEVMRTASHFDVSVHPISTGKNWGYGTALPTRDDSVILDLSNLRRILHFDAELGVVTLEPGVTQGMLREFLDEGGHPFLVPVTGAGPECSLLGNALERGYGVTPESDHFAAVTDIEAVLADGSIYRSRMREAGGEDLARLFKWGIGPYMNGLFTQSGFGIVTRMTIALARRPECIKIVVFGLRDEALLEPAVERIRRILSALPGILGGVNLMNRHRVLAMSAPYPTDQVGVDGLIPAEVIEAMGRAYQVMPWSGFATLYGTRSVVRAAQREIRSALAGVASRLFFLSPSFAKPLERLARLLPSRLGARFGSTATTLARSLDLVAGRPNETALPLCYWRNAAALPVGRPLDPARDGCGLIWYSPLVPMRPTAVREYSSMVVSCCRRHAVEPLITLTSLGDRLFDSTVPILFNREIPAQVAAAQACHDVLFQEGRVQGFFPYRVGVSAMSTLHALGSGGAEVQRRVLEALDPQRLIAPGRYD